MASFKRARSPHHYDASPSSSRHSSPTLKAARTSATPPPNATQPPSQILCQLPPTCNPPNHPTPLAGTHELETHYATYHAHVCEQKGCGCVFPDERFLELHFTECHDPIAAMRKERGGKIFACHLATCPRLFSTPKTRRLHLIEAHSYPKEYFFAVTNKGIGGLLKRWGQGASMLRQPWRARGDEDEQSDEERKDNSEEDGDDTTVVSNDEEDEILLEKVPVDRASGPAGSTTSDVTARPSRNRRTRNRKRQNPGADVDNLTDALGSLALVPGSIQFGRGAKRGTRSRGGGPGHASGWSADSTSGTADVGVDRGRNMRGRWHGRGSGRSEFPIPRGGALRGGMLRERGRGMGMPRGATILGRGSGRGGGIL